MTFSAGQGIAVLGPAWLGWVRHGFARPGEAGNGWMVSGAVRLRTTHERPGSARHGEARQGAAWQAQVWQGEARGGWTVSAGVRLPGTHARLGKARRCVAWLAMVGRGRAWAGKAWRGMARRGLAWPGVVRHGKGAGEWHTSGFESRTPTHEARPGEAWHGRGWLGLAMPGAAGRGKEAGGWQPLGFEAPAPTRGRAGQGNAWLGRPRPGEAGTTQQLKEQPMFEVKGDRAQWRTVFEHISAMNIGDTIKHEELAALLPDAPEQSVRSAFYRAVKECETEHKRTFASVRGVGYKMAHARENERLAGGAFKRAKRQLKTAKRKASSADRSLLTREERARIDAVELNLARHIEMTNRRLDRVEAGLEAAREQARAARREQRTDSAVLAERVDKLAELLTKHGITEPVPA